MCKHIKTKPAPIRYQALRRVQYNTYQLCVSSLQLFSRPRKEFCKLCGHFFTCSDSSPEGSLGHRTHHSLWAVPTTQQFCFCLQLLAKAVAILCGFDRFQNSETSSEGHGTDSSQIQTFSSLVLPNTQSPCTGNHFNTSTDLHWKCTAIDENVLKKNPKTNQNTIWGLSSKRWSWENLYFPEEFSFDAVILSPGVSGNTW